MTTSRIAFSSTFPGVCACREQQKYSNDNKGIAKLLCDFLFSPICEDSSALSCPGVGCSWTLLHELALIAKIIALICQEPAPRIHLQEEIPTADKRKGLISRRR